MNAIRYLNMLFIPCMKMSICDCSCYIFIVDYRLALCMIAAMPASIYNFRQLKAVKPAFHNKRECQV